MFLHRSYTAYVKFCTKDAYTYNIDVITFMEQLNAYVNWLYNFIFMINLYFIVRTQCKRGQKFIVLKIFFKFIFYWYCIGYMPSTHIFKNTLFLLITFHLYQDFRTLNPRTYTQAQLAKDKLIAL